MDGDAYKFLSVKFIKRKRLIYWGAFCDRFEEHGYSVQTEGNAETGVLHLLAFRQSE